MVTLADVDIFQDLPPEALTRLAAHAWTRKVAPGTPLLRQGEVDPTMFVIVHGRVRKERSHPDLSEPAEVFELGSGESVGEFGLLDAEPRPETVTVVDESEVIVLSARTLAETLLLYPLLSLGLLQSLSRSIRSLEALEVCARGLPKPADGMPRDGQEH
jgi:CRP-like cAMP-binding protein